jgi:hypothetical protein
MWLLGLHGGRDVLPMTGEQQAQPMSEGGIRGYLRVSRISLRGYGLPELRETPARILAGRVLDREADNGWLQHHWFMVYPAVPSMNGARAGFEISGSL